MLGGIWSGLAISAQALNRLSLALASLNASLTRPKRTLEAPLKRP